MKKSPLSSQVTPLSPRRPSRSEAEDAVRTLIAWSGDNPARPGLEKTPARVSDAFGEYFSGYGADPIAELEAGTFDDPSAYDDMVLLKGINFESHCEHHIAPFFGVAHVAYRPKDRVVGLSKIARVVDIFARRLQTQERLSGEIAAALMEGLDAKGVAIMMTARHHCMAARGAQQPHVETVTFRFLGDFEHDSELRARFTAAVRE
ncbi:GTP cyclohydrolase I FolE [Hyphomicrobium methylovorum]|uniref:GTP cyclohydrolase I n=1 Tax=Hyphomicrobium methylovorum TaxID=84 RepID=UPI0015E6DC8B|nr:GTP cyclohydrolase I [Hyphomicrobium methylovorum]MBA2124795.1 GTP cyclohydrolase I FolE [Hyphomicrobium methylovorum]